MRKYLMKRKTLLAIVGPTAIGKTKLAIALANHYKTDIISADSRQFFKEMSIGTAVPSKEELQQAPHHFIQHKSIFDSYTVGDFEKEALLVLEELFIEKDVVVMVGGSGLYIDAVLKGLDYFPAVNPKIRQDLNALFQKKGIQPLKEQLQQLDPEQYAKMDTENPHRLIRALEVSIGSGKPYSSFLNKQKPKRPFQIISLGLSAERTIIYERINERVDLMMAAGLEEEAKVLFKHQGLNALQTVGYRELFSYFNKNLSLEEAVSEIKKNTRRFAKRQGTWFKKNENITWFSHDYKLNELIQIIEEKLIK